MGKKKVEYTDKKRKFESREGKDLVKGKSMTELRKKYLGEDAASDSASTKPDPKVKVRIIKRTETGQDSDYTVQERTAILKDGKVIGEQG